MSEEILPPDEIDIPPGHAYALPMGKVNRFVFLWRNGRKEHFPVCCIFRFAFEDALQDGKFTPIEKLSGVKRGSIQKGDTVFVPCNIFHRKTEEQT